MSEPDQIQPAQHTDPGAGPTMGWSAADVGDSEYVGDAETEQQTTLTADGTQADQLLGDDAVD